ncbi:MAG TPA: YbhB/YbcL family Raf kinase inhibitor-like protein [Caulobacteraceae bacterium]
MSVRLATLLALGFFAVGSAVAAAPALVLSRVPAKSAASVTVGSTAIGPDHLVAQRNTAFGQGLSPEVNWNSAPGARAYAVILEDPDAPGAKPFVHWLAWNIPATVTRLAEGVPTTGAIEGRNDHGGNGYWGPHPPSGTHHYHLQVFALDAPLVLTAGADRDALAAAMRGHVLASGEIVGLVTAPTH